MRIMRLFGVAIAVLAICLLGAHYFRQRELGMVGYCVGLLLFAVHKDAWKNLVASVGLLWGIAVWGKTAGTIIQMRMMFEQPWLKAAIIIGGVAVFTFLAGRLLLAQAERKAVEQEYNQNTLFFKTVVFFCCSGVLFLMQAKIAMPLYFIERFFPGFAGIQIFLVSWYGAYLAENLVIPATQSKARIRLWFVFSLVFFGQLALGMFGVPNMLMTGTLHVPVPAVIAYAPFYKGSSMMPLLFFFSTLLVGSAWCSHLCYFGAWDALASCTTKKQNFTPFQRKFVVWGRVVILIAGCAMAYSMKKIGVPALWAGITGVAFGGVGLLCMCIFSRRQGIMVHCTMFCPMGLLATLVGKLSFWRMGYDAAACTQCGSCQRVCRYGALDGLYKAELHKDELYKDTLPAEKSQGKIGLTCTLCRDCTSVCKPQALYVRCLVAPKGLSTYIFVGLVVVVHIVFLTVARV